MGFRVSSVAASVFAEMAAFLARKSLLALRTRQLAVAGQGLHNPQNYGFRFGAHPYSTKIGLIQHKEDLPLHVDWRKRGCVSPVIKQGDCSSCWAIAVTSTVESLYKIVIGSSVRLSSQELLDCCDNLGHDNGDFALAYQYIIDHGIGLEKDYKYQGEHDLPCRRDMSKSRIRINDYVKVSSNERSLMEAVAAQPVAVSVCAGDELVDYEDHVLLLNFMQYCLWATEHIKAKTIGSSRILGEKHGAIKDLAIYGEIVACHMANAGLY